MSYVTNRIIPTYGPEIYCRPDTDVLPAVAMSVTVHLSGIGVHAFACLTPDQARELAASIISCALIVDKALKQNSSTTEPA